MARYEFWTTYTAQHRCEIDVSDDVDDVEGWIEDHLDSAEIFEDDVYGGDHDGVDDVRLLED